jgi:hypothetical protein
MKLTNQYMHQNEENNSERTEQKLTNQINKVTHYYQKIPTYWNKNSTVHTFCGSIHYDKKASYTSSVSL